MLIEKRPPQTPDFAYDFPCIDIVMMLTYLVGYIFVGDTKMLLPGFLSFRSQKLGTLKPPGSK